MMKRNRIGEYKNGRLVIEFHDQEGLPVELGMFFMHQNGFRVSLLGVLIEAAKRRWSDKLLREAIEAWLEYHTPEGAQIDALKHLLDSGKLRPTPKLLAALK